MNTATLSIRARTLLERAITPDLLAVAARLSLAAIFFLSARTKVDGWFHITDSAFSLFEEEYALPLIGPALAAYVTVVACVFPGGWPTHLSWAALALLLASYGGGRLSLDRLLFGQASR